MISSISKPVERNQSMAPVVYWNKVIIFIFGYFFCKTHWICHHSTSQHEGLWRIITEHGTRQIMKTILFAINNNSMTCVGSAIESYHDLVLMRNSINNLAFLMNPYSLGKRSCCPAPSI